MEPGGGRRLRLVGLLLRQHRAPRPLDVAACVLRRTRSRARDRRQQCRSRLVDVRIRCLQALRERRMPGRLSDRRPGTHRVWRRLPAADVCNGCSYCVVVCPFGVVQKQSPTTAARSSALSATTGRKKGLKPACATACPTESIKFGHIEQMRDRRPGTHGRTAVARHGRRALLDPTHTSVGGIHAAFIVRGDPSNTICRRTLKCRRAT